MCTLRWMVGQETKSRHGFSQWEIQIDWMKIDWFVDVFPCDWPGNRPAPASPRSVRFVLAYRGEFFSFVLAEFFSVLTGSLVSG